MRTPFSWRTASDCAAKDRSGRNRTYPRQTPKAFAVRIQSQTQAMLKIHRSMTELQRHGLPEEPKNQVLQPAVKMHDVHHIRYRSGSRQTSGVAVDGVPGLFSGACRCLVENEADRQVSLKLKTLE